MSNFFIIDDGNGDVIDRIELAEGCGDPNTVRQALHKIPGCEWLGLEYVMGPRKFESLDAFTAYVAKRWGD